MGESNRHNQLKKRDAHITGQTEVTLSSGKKLDALSPTRIATGVERSGPTGIRKSVSTLKEAVESGMARKARLRVPHVDLDDAYKEMRRQRLAGELSNLSGTSKTRVPKRKK